MCNTLLRTEKVKSRIILTILLVFVLTGFAQAQQTITRYVRLGGNDFHTGTTPLEDPTNPSSAFATIQRAIDEFDASNGYINPTTGLPVTGLAFGTTYIIDVGPGIYNDPGTIFIPPGYAKPGTEIGNSIRLIIRGAKVGITPNQEAFPGGPNIREYSPATETIIQTSYGATTIGGLRPKHRPLRSSTPGPFGGPAQNPLGLGVHNEIFNIGKDNYVVFEGLYFEATPNNGGGVAGGRIIEVDNRSTVINESRSTTNLEFYKNIFIGLNQSGGYNFDPNNANPLVREVDMGLNSFQDIVALKMDDNRFMNVTWDGGLQPYAFPNNGKESSRAIALNIYKIFKVDLTNNHFVGRFDPPNQNVTNTMDLAVQIHGTYDGTTINFVNNQVSNNRGGGIYVDNSAIFQQDLVTIRNNRFLGLKTRDVLSSTGQGITTGIAVIGSRSAMVSENRLDMIAGSSIYLQSLRQHATNVGQMHKVTLNIISNGMQGRTPLSDGITALYNRDLEISYNTITDTWRSGVHVSDFVNSQSNGHMMTRNVMVSYNTIRRANRGPAGLGGEAEELRQSGGVAIFSHYGNTLQFNGTSKIYVHNNIIDRAANAGVILRNNNLTTNDILLVDPTLSVSNYYKKDIRINKNLLIENGGGQNGAGFMALIQNTSQSLDGIFGRWGQVDATANWWGKTTGTIGPNDNDNPLNLGAGTGQRVVEFGAQTNAVLYSPWIGGRVSEIGTPPAQIDSNGPDDDLATGGYQQLSPIIYYGSELFGLSPTFLTPQSLSLFPTIDVGGVNGMINKAISHARSNDIIEMYRGFYQENVVVPVNFGNLIIRTANFNSTKMVSANTSCTDATQVMKPLEVKAPARPGVDPPYRGVGAPVALNACNTEFRVPFINDFSQEATIKQVPTLTMGAALNVLNGNNLTFEGFRLLTVNNQAVNSDGANTGVKFMFNLIEVETPNKNNVGEGLVSFNNHDLPIGIVKNVFRGINGQSALNAVALNIFNTDTAYVAMNSFAGQQIMSTGVRIDRSSGNTPNAINVTMNEFTGTYQSAILVVDNAQAPTRNVGITYNEIVGNNTLMGADHAGITFTSDNANTRAFNIMYNNIRNNKRAGILARSGNVNGRRIAINYNVIHNNDANGLISNATGRLDATGNWWGSSAGPDIASNRDNNGTLLKGTPINDIFGGGVFPLTAQQRIDGTGRNNVAYSPWLGGQAEDQVRNPKMIPDPTVDPLTNPNPPMIDNTDPPNGLFPYRGELDNSALYNGTLSPDRDANTFGVQFKTPFATFEEFPEQNAWYIGVVTAGVGSPIPSTITNAAPSFVQRANDLAVDGDDIYFHDDDYTPTAGPAESVIFTKGLSLTAAFTTKNAAGAPMPGNRPSSKILDITVRDGKVIEMLTDFEARNITLAGSANGSIYTFPYRFITQRFTVANLPAAEKLPRLYQLYRAGDLNTLTYSGVATEGNNKRYVVGSLKQTVANVGTSSTDFGKIGFALVAGGGATNLGSWTVTRTAGTKNQQPTYPAGASQFNTDLPNVQDLFVEGFAPDPRTPPQLLRPDVSPFIVNGFHSIDRGYRVQYTGAAPAQGWSIKMDWVSDDDPFVLDNDNNASTPNPAYQYPATMIVRASKDGGNTWPPVMPYDVVLGNNPRQFPSTPGVTVPINPTTFANNQALFTILDYDPTLKAYAGANRAMCIGDPGLVLGGDGIPGPTATTARGGLAPYKYSWSPSTGLNFSDIANPIATPTQPGTYFYTVTVTDAVGFTAQNTVTIFVNPKPMVDIGPDRTVCINDDIQLLTSNVSGGRKFGPGQNTMGLDYLYYWTSSPSLGGALSQDQNDIAELDPNHPDVIPFQEYTITLEVEDANGCIQTDVMKLIVNDAPSANAGANRDICIDGNHVLGANVPGSGGTGALSYSWTLMSKRTFSNQNIPFAPGIESALLSSTSAPKPIFTPNVDGNTGPIGNYTFRLTVTDENGCSSFDDIRVGVYPLPTANAGADQVYCYTGGSVILGGAPVGGAGTPAYSYMWASNDPNSSTSYLSSQTANGQIRFTAPAEGSVAYPYSFSYMVNVTDSKGCKAMDDVKITVYPELVADAGPDIQSCVNSQYILGGAPTAKGGSGAYAYVWTPNQGLINENIPNNQFTPNPIGQLEFVGTYNYTLKVTDLEIGCEDIDQVQVVITPKLMVSVGPDRTICAGNDVQLNAVVPGAAVGNVYNYSWAPGANLSNPNIAAPVFNTTVPGTYMYTVTVTDQNNCLGQDDIQIVVFPNPIANAGPDRAFCSGGSAILAGSASGGTPVFPNGYTYVWSPNEGLNNNIFAPAPTVSLNFAGTYAYTLTVRDANQCVGTDVANVTVFALPVANAGASQTVCAGQMVTLSGAASGGSGGYSYSWVPGPGNGLALQNANSANPMFVSVAPGNYAYWLVVTDANGCSSAPSEVLITVKAAPTANAGPDRSICVGGNTQLNGTGTGTTAFGVIYAWSPASFLSDANIRNPLFSAAPAGTYTYTLTTTDVNGCTATDVMEVVVNPNPVANAGGSYIACAGSSIALNGSASSGTPGYSYSWAPSANLVGANSASPMFMSNSPGSFSYTLTVTDSKGCTGTAPASVLVRSLPSLVAQPATVSLCVNNPVVLSVVASGGSGGYLYNWSPSAGLDDATSPNPTFVSSILGVYNYTVTVTDANGCQGTTSVVVNNSNSLLVDAGPDRAICLSNGVFSTQLSGSYAGTGSQVVVKWTPANNLSSTTTLNPIFSSNISGTYVYTLTVTDVNGCSSSDQVTVNVSNGIIADAGSDLIICSSGSINLNAMGNSGSGSYSYQWNPPFSLSNPNIANPVFANPAIGIYPYTVVVTDNATGCTSMDMVNVRVVPDQNITLVATFTNTSCPGGTNGTITATALIDANSEFQVFQYSLDGVNWQSSNFFSGLSAGIYTVYTRNQANCPVSTLVTVGDPNPTLITNITGITESSALVSWNTAPGQTFVLQYRVIGANDWITAAQNISGGSFMLSGLQNFTNYEVRVRAICAGTPLEFSPVATFRTLVTPNGTCKVPGGILVNQIDGSNSVNVMWNADQTGVCYTIAYGQTGTNPSGWNQIAGVQGTQIGDMRSFVINGLTPGVTYSVRIRTNCNVCPATGSNLSAWSPQVQFTVDNMKDGASAAVAAAQPALKVYPNPTRGNVTVAFDAIEAGDASVVAYDITGRVVFEKSFNTISGSNELPIDLSGNAAGVYTLKVKQSDIETNIKVVLQ